MCEVIILTILYYLSGPKNLHVLRHEFLDTEESPYLLEEWLWVLNTEPHICKAHTFLLSYMAMPSLKNSSAELEIKLTGLFACRNSELNIYHCDQVDSTLYYYSNCWRTTL